MYVTSGRDRLPAARIPQVDPGVHSSWPKRNIASRAEYSLGPEILSTYIVFLDCFQPNM